MTTSLRGHKNLWVGAPCVSHHADKSCDHKHCVVGDAMFLICHLTSCEDMFKGFCEFMGGNRSR